MSNPNPQTTSVGFIQDTVDRVTRVNINLVRLQKARTAINHATQEINDVTEDLQRDITYIQQAAEQLLRLAKHNESLSLEKFGIDLKAGGLASSLVETAQEIEGLPPRVQAVAVDEQLASAVPRRHPASAELANLASTSDVRKEAVESLGQARDVVMGAAQKLQNALGDGPLSRALQAAPNDGEHRPPRVQSRPAGNERLIQLERIRGIKSLPATYLSPTALSGARGFLKPSDKLEYYAVDMYNTSGPASAKWPSAFCAKPRDPQDSLTLFINSENQIQILLDLTHPHTITDFLVFARDIHSEVWTDIESYGPETLKAIADTLEFQLKQLLKASGQ